MKNVWRFTAPGKQEKELGRHPTQKPIRLLERLLAASCPDDCVVLDPFNGSGTTGVAALRAGHRYVGIELDPEYLELTKRRIESEICSGQLADALPPAAPLSVLPMRRPASDHVEVS